MTVAGFWGSLNPADERQAIAEMNARRARMDTFTSTATPDLAARVTDIGDAYPFLEPDVAYAAGHAGFVPDDPRMQAIAHAAVQARTAPEGLGKYQPGQVVTPQQVEDDDGWWDDVREIGKGVVRGAFMAMDSLYTDFIARPITAAYADISDNTSLGDTGFWDAYDQTAPSELALVKRNVWANRDKGFNVFDEGGLEESAFGGIDVGSGFFAGGEMGRTRDDVAKRLRFDSGAHMTIGRIIPELINDAGNTYFDDRMVIEPGTAAYNLTSGIADFAATIALDPASWLTGGVAKAGKVRQGFGEAAEFLPKTQRAMRGVGLDPVANALQAGASKVAGIGGHSFGLIDGAPRKTILPEVASRNFLQSRIGQAVKEDLAADTSITSIRNKLREQGDAQLWRELRDAPDANTVDTILHNAIAGDGLGVPKITKNFANTHLTAGMPRPRGMTQRALYGSGVSVKRHAPGNWRITASMPSGRLDYEDPTAGMKDLIAVARTAKLDRDDIDDLAYRWSQVTPGDGGAALNVFSDLTKKIVEKATDYESPLAMARLGRKANVDKIEELVFNTLKDFRNKDVAYSTNARGNVNVLGAEVNARGDVMAQAQLATEQLQRSIPLFDMRELRREISFLNRFFDLPGAKGGIDGLSAVMTTLIKPLQLIRPAYVTRQALEEQGRMAGNGYAAVLNHPFSYIAYAMGDGKIGRIIKRNKGIATYEEVIDPRTGNLVRRPLDTDVTVTGQSMKRMDTWARMMNNRQTQQQFFGTVGIDLWDTTKFFDDHRGADYLARELAQIWGDDVSRRIANGGLLPGDVAPNAATLTDPMDLVEDWLVNGNGRPFLEQGANVTDTILHKTADRRRWLLDKEARVHEKTGGKVEYDATNAPVRVLQGGDRELLDMLVYREFVDDAGDLHSLDGVLLTGKNKTSQALVNRLNTLKRNGVGPETVKYERTLAGDIPGLGPSAKLFSHLDRATSWGFQQVASKPTNYLARGPLGRQAYWKHLKRLMPHASQEVQEAILKGAKDAGLDGWIGDRRLIRSLEKIVNDPSIVGGKLDSLEDADRAARFFAVDEVKEILFDLSRRGQAGDVLRIIVPYADAWKEIGSSWARIARQNPQAVRRIQQGIEGARGQDTDPTTGIFWSDQTTGEEMFSYPIVGELMSKWMFRDPEGEQVAEVDFAGRVGGLNIIGQIMPGLGPVATIPAGALLGDSPKLDAFNELLFPFGSPDTEEGLLESQFPPYLQKIMRGWRADESDRMYANSVWDVARGLVRTGNYSLSSPEEMQRTIEAAKRHARALYFVRGFTQWAGPTGPGFAFSYDDLEGNAWQYKLLSDEYQTLLDETGSQTAAAQVMIDRFGPTFGAMIQGKSASIRPTVDTKTGDRWRRDNEDLFDTYPDIAGLFAPQAEPGVQDFDYSAYLRGFAEGDRVQLSPQQMALLSNDFLGRLAYDNARTQAEQLPPGQRQIWLAQAKMLISEKYPGFDQNVGVPEGADPEDQIMHIEQAMGDDRIGQSPAGRGTAEYLQARAEAMAQIQSMGLGGFTSATAAPISDHLRAEAVAIAQRYPEFTIVFERVFSRELGDETTTARAA